MEENSDVNQKSWRHTTVIRVLSLIILTPVLLHIIVSISMSGYFIFISNFRGNEKRLAKPVDEATLTPHSLRHQAATDLHKNGANIRYVQKFLGHANLNTTQIYTKVDISDLKKIHQKCHSRERQRTDAKEFKSPA